ncbi:MAG: hypothetical protein HQK63_15735 [Desulfamplus sp.]|nr:hypothetical protein [Desulfamplus sp.]
MKTLKLTLIIQLLAIIITSHALFASEPPIVGDPENATWEIFANRSQVHTLLKSDDGKVLWVGTNGGLEKRDAVTGEIIQVFTNLDGLPENEVTSLVADGSGGLWIGTGSWISDVGGLAHLQADGTWEKFSVAVLELTSVAITSLLLDGNGGIWIGTSDGLIHLKSDKTGDEFTISNSELPDDWVTSLLSDGTGGIWIGTNDGLAHFKADGTWEVFGTHNSVLPDQYIDSLLSDGSGGLWIGVGSYNGGLAHLKSDGTWEIFKDDNSMLPDNRVFTLLSDDNGGV